MTESNLTGDVIAVSWAGAAGASARERAQEENAKAPRTRSRSVQSKPESSAPIDEEPAGEMQHEIDSFA